MSTRNDYFLLSKYNFIVLQQENKIVASELSFSAQHLILPGFRHIFPLLPKNIHPPCFTVTVFIQ